jgi:hypothetical protein
MEDTDLEYVPLVGFNIGAVDIFLLEVLTSSAYFDPLKPTGYVMHQQI